VSLITYLTRVHFADNVLEDALSVEIARHRIRRPLIISDVDATGSEELERLFHALPTSVSPVPFVAGSALDSTKTHARAHRLLARNECDALIGFGGMDALDLVRLLGDADHPVITIPTRTETIGLGPLGVRSALVPGKRPELPVAILCDATLTLSASPAATAAAGLDALVHCLESFLSTAFNPPADGIALDGLRRAALHLEAAVKDGQDITARRELLAVALNAGLASDKGYGGVEAASNGLQSAAKVPHGALHGALLTEVLTFNTPAVSDRFALISTALGLPARISIADHLASLVERIGLQRRLSKIGIKAHHLEQAARQAAADPANRTNPRLATADDYETMMRAAF